MKFAVAAITIGLSTTLAHAQTAVETVAFLSLGIEGSKNSGMSFREEVSSSGKELRYKLYGSSGILSDLVITETDKCVFQIKGPRFNSDRIIQANYTIDFNGLLPQEPENLRNTDEDNVFQKVVYYMRIPGVTVCSKGESFTWPRENFPPAGECTSSMKTKPVGPGGNLDRQIAALKYFRQNFCTGKAF